MSTINSPIPVLGQSQTVPAAEPVETPLPNLSPYVLPTPADEVVAPAPAPQPETAFGTAVNEVQDFGRELGRQATNVIPGSALHAGFEAIGSTLGTAADFTLEQLYGGNAEELATKLENQAKAQQDPERAFKLRSRANAIREARRAIGLDELRKSTLELASGSGSAITGAGGAFLGQQDPMSREQYAQTLNNPEGWGTFIGGLTGSVAMSGLAMVQPTLAPAVLASFGAMGFTSTKQEYIDRMTELGIEPDMAIADTVGLAGGLIELATERIGLDVIPDSIRKRVIAELAQAAVEGEVRTVAKTLARVAAQAVPGAAVESLEEALATIGQNASVLIGEMIQTGNVPTQDQAAERLFSGIGESMLGGAIAGGALSAPVATYGTIKAEKAAYRQAAKQRLERSNLGDFDGLAAVDDYAIADAAMGSNEYQFTVGGSELGRKEAAAEAKRRGLTLSMLDLSSRDGLEAAASDEKKAPMARAAMARLFALENVGLGAEAAMFSRGDIRALTGEANIGEYNSGAARRRIAQDLSGRFSEDGTVITEPVAMPERQAESAERAGPEAVEPNADDEILASVARTQGPGTKISSVPRSRIGERERAVEDMARKRGLRVVWFTGRFKKDDGTDTATSGFYVPGAKGTVFLRHSSGMKFDDASVLDAYMGLIAHEASHDNEQTDQGMADVIGLLKAAIPSFSSMTFEDKVAWANQRGYDASILTRANIDGELAAMIQENPNTLEEAGLMSALRSDRSRMGRALDYIRRTATRFGLRGKEAQALLKHVKKSIDNPAQAAMQTLSPSTVANIERAAQDERSLESRLSASRRERSVFRSKLFESMASMPQRKATPAQVIAHLKKAGVKDEEILFTGINEAMDGMKTVDVDAVMKVLTPVEVRETILSELTDEQIQVMARIQIAKQYKVEKISAKGSEPRYRLAYVGNDLDLARDQGEFDTKAEAIEARDEKVDFWLSNLPSEELSKYVPQQAKYGRDKHDFLVYPGEYDKYLEVLLRWTPTGAPFKTTHFPQEDILVHARITIRDNPDEEVGGKALFVEEIQSDWHQGGRKYGYVPKQTSARFKGISQDDLVVNVIERRLFSESDQITFNGEDAKVPMVNGYFADVVARNAENDLRDSGVVVISASSGNIEFEPVDSSIPSTWGRGVFFSRPPMDRRGSSMKAWKEELEAAREFIYEISAKDDPSNVLARFGSIGTYQLPVDGVKNEAVELYSTGRDNPGNEPAPDAPFKSTQSWTSLILKRLVALAANTPRVRSIVMVDPAGTADRYGYEYYEDISSISITRQRVPPSFPEWRQFDATPLYSLDITQFEEEEPTRVVDYGIIDEIEHKVGRELLQQLMPQLEESGFARLDNPPAGTVVGAVKYKKYYGEIVPREMAKLAKSLGVEMTTTSFDRSGGDDIWVELPTIPITPDVRKQVKAVGFPLFTAGNRLQLGTYYSVIKNTIDGSTQRRMTAQQLVAMLKKAGVKDEELYWSGLEDFLRDAEGTVNLDSVSQVVEPVLLETKELVAPSIQAIDDEYISWMRDNSGVYQRAGHYWVSFDGEQIGENYDTRSEAEDALDQYLIERAEGDGDWVEKARLIGGISDEDGDLVKYGPGSEHGRQMILPGNFEDYYEILITLDETRDAPGSDAIYARGHYEDAQVLVHARITFRRLPNGQRTLFIEEIQSDWHQTGRKKGYRSSVSPELTKKENWKLKANSIKVSDIPPENFKYEVSSQIVDGRVLPVVSIQIRNTDVFKFPGSTEDGRLRVIRTNGVVIETQNGEWEDLPTLYGARTPELEQFTISSELLGQEQRDRNADIGLWLRGQKIRTLGASNSVDGSADVALAPYGLRIESARLNRELAGYVVNGVVNSIYGGRVPDAPFKSSNAWTALALKRLMSVAANAGVSSVSIIDGNQTAIRYNKQIRENVEAIRLTRSEFEPEFYKLAVRSSGSSDFSHVGSVDRTNLADYVGEAMSSDLLRMIDENPSEPAVISGENMRVGDASYQQYYDRVAAKEFAKIAKHVGSTVTSVDIPMDSGQVFTAKAIQLDSDTINRIRENGFPLFTAADRDRSGRDRFGTFSTLARVVADSPVRKMTSQQLMALLKKNGVKDEEIYWTGVEDYLRGRDKVNLDEVMGAIRPVIIGQQNVVGEIDEEARERSWQEAWDRRFSEVRAGLQIEEVDTEVVEDGEELLRVVYRLTDENGNVLSEHGDHDSAQEASFAVAERRMERENIDVDVPESTGSYGDYRIPGDSIRYFEFLLTLDDASGSALGTRKFESDHWEPENILVHARGALRNDTDGTLVMFVEEIQSDWHQLARKKGYENAELNRRVNSEPWVVSKGSTKPFEDADDFIVLFDVPPAGLWNETEQLFVPGNINYIRVFAKKPKNYADYFDPAATPEKMVYREVDRDWKLQADGDRRHSDSWFIEGYQRVRPYPSKEELDQYVCVPTGTSSGFDTNFAVLRAIQRLGEIYPEQSKNWVTPWSGIPESKRNEFIDLLRVELENAARNLVLHYSHIRAISDTSLNDAPVNALIKVDSGRNYHVARSYSLEAHRERYISAVSSEGQRASGRPLPDAPFKSSGAWSALMLKRLMVYALEEHGVRKIAVTDSEEVAKVNNAALVQRIDEVKVVPDATGGFPLESDGRVSVFVKRIDQRGEVSDYMHAWSGPLNQLGTVITAEAAATMHDRVVAGQTVEMRASDMTMPGNKYDTHYNVVIPKELNRIGAKYGTKISRVGIDVSGIRTSPNVKQFVSLEINADMEQDILLNGFPLFSAAAPFTRREFNAHIIGLFDENYAQTGVIDQTTGYLLDDGTPVSMGVGQRYDDHRSIVGGLGELRRLGVSAEAINAYRDDRMGSRTAAMYEIMSAGNMLRMHVSPTEMFVEFNQSQNPTPRQRAAIRDWIIENRPSRVTVDIHRSMNDTVSEEFENPDGEEVSRYMMFSATKRRMRLASYSDRLAVAVGEFDKKAASSIRKAREGLVAGRIDVDGFDQAVTVASGKYLGRGNVAAMRRMAITSAYDFARKPGSISMSAGKKTLRGEYWLDRKSAFNFLDATDGGSYNHEMQAAALAYQDLIYIADDSGINMPFDGDEIHEIDMRSDGYAELLGEEPSPDAWRKFAKKLASDESSAESAMKIMGDPSRWEFMVIPPKYRNAQQAIERLIEFAFMRGLDGSTVDSRNYAFGKGWIRLDENGIQMARIDSEAMQTIVSALYNIHGENADGQLFDVEVFNPNQTARVFEDVPIDVLSSGSVAKLAPFRTASFTASGRRSPSNRSDDYQVAKGQKAIVARISREITQGKLDAYTGTRMLSVIGLMGEAANRTTGIRFRKMQNGILGQMDFARDVVTISQQAIEQGRAIETLIHEFWHSASRFLDPVMVERVKKDYEKNVEIFIQKNGWNPRWLSENAMVQEHVIKSGIPFYDIYKLLNLDEWIAVTMAERTMKALGKTHATTLPGTVLSQESKDVLDYLSDVFYGSVADTANALLGVENGLYDNLADRFLTADIARIPAHSFPNGLEWGAYSVFTRSGNMTPFPMSGPTEIATYGNPVTDLLKAIPFARDVLATRFSSSRRRSKPISTMVDDVADMQSMLVLARTKRFQNQRQFRMEMQNAVRAAAEAEGVDLSEDTPERRLYIARVMEREARAALKQNVNGVGWYDLKVRVALAVHALIHPEILTDRNSKFTFIYILATTSNGMKVNDNFKLASKVYKSYKKTGVLPTNMGQGTAADAMNESFELYNRMVAKMGLNKFRRVMTTKATVKAIERATGVAIGGEGKSTIVYGAAVIGPKIGNGFFANLYGNFEQLTMDRWYVRAWTRYIGQQVFENKSDIARKRANIRALIDMLTPEERAQIEDAVGFRLSKAKVDETAKAMKRATTDARVREKLMRIGVTDDRTSDLLTEIFGKERSNSKFVSKGNMMRRATNGLMTALDGRIEAPAGVAERDEMRAVTAMVLDRLRSDYPDLTMADLQAILWFPEKLLYDVAKKNTDVGEKDDAEYEQSEAPDYANAAVALAIDEGVDETEIRKAVENVERAIAAERAAAAGGVDQGGAGAAPSRPGDISLEGEPGSFPVAVAGLVQTGESGYTPSVSEVASRWSSYPAPEFTKYLEDLSRDQWFSTWIDGSAAASADRVPTVVRIAAPGIDLPVFSDVAGQSGVPMFLAIKAPFRVSTGSSGMLTAGQLAAQFRILPGQGDITMQVADGATESTESTFEDIWKAQPNSVRRELAEAINAFGNDGIVAPRGQGATSFVPFEMEQIKFVERANWDVGIPSFSASARPALHTDLAAGRRTFDTSRWMRFRARSQDQYVQLEKAIADIESASGELPASMNPLLAIRRMPGAIAARQKSFRSKRVNPLLGRMRDAGISMRDMGEFLYALHAPQRNAYVRETNPGSEGVGSGMTDEAAARIVGTVNARRDAAVWRSIAAEWQAIARESLDTQLAAGLIRQSDYDNITARYGAYIPMPDAPTGSGPALENEVKRFSLGRQQLRQTVGRGESAAGDESFVAVIPHIVGQRETVMSRAYRNIVANRFMLLAMAHPEPNLWRIFRPGMRRMMNVRSGVVEEVEDQSWRDDPQVMQVLAIRPTTYTTTDQVDGRPVETTHVAERGEMVLIRIGDPVVGATLTRGAVPTEHWAMSLVRVARLWSRWVRWSSTSAFNPDFTFTNPARDAQTAIATIATEEEKAKKILVDMGKLYGKSFKTVMNYLRERPLGELGKEWEQFVSLGGMQSLYVPQEFDERYAELARELEDPTKWRNMSSGARKVLVDAWDNLNSSFDNAVRFAFFVAAVRNGVQPEVAIVKARNLTVDFNKRGSDTGILWTMYAFGNAGLQGTAKTMRLVKSRRGRQILGSLFAIGFMQAMLIDLLGDDDEDLNGVKDAAQVQDYIHNTNLVIPTGLGIAIKIPLSYGLNVPYVMGRNLYRAAAGRISIANAMSQTVGTLLSTFNPIGGESIIDNGHGFLRALAPDVLDLPIDMAFGKDWRGNDLYKVSPWETDPVLSETGSTKVPEPMKAFLRMLNDASGGDYATKGFIDLPPDAVWYLFVQLAGGGGRAIERLGETIANTMQGEFEVSVAPGLRRFFEQYPTPEQNAAIYYALRDEVGGLDARLGRYRTERERNVARESNPAASRSIQAFKAAESDLKELRARVRKLRAGGGSTSAIDAAERQMIEARARAVAAYMRNKR